MRAFKLRWRSRLRAGWAAAAPILHLDATLRPELVETYLPLIDIGATVAACQDHVRIRQVTGSPTSARALTPASDARDRDRKAAVTHLRDLSAWIALRARQCRRPGARVDLLVVGQKAAIDALRAAGLPPRVDALHFNALSGLDRWGDIGGMIVLGRTLPAPRTVELIAIALTGRVPAPNPEEAGWWYPMAEAPPAAGQWQDRASRHRDPCRPDRRGRALEHLRGRAHPGDGARPRCQPHRRHGARDRPADRRRPAGDGGRAGPVVRAAGRPDATSWRSRGSRWRTPRTWRSAFPIFGPRPMPPGKTGRGGRQTAIIGISIIAKCHTPPLM